MWSKVKEWFASHGVDSAALSDAGFRAAKTAVQAFLAVAPISAVMTGDKAVIIAGLSAAGSALLAFVWNLLLTWSRSDNSTTEDTYSA